MIFPLSRVVENNSFWDMSHNCRKLAGTSYFKFVLCFQNSLKGHQKIQNKEWIYQTRHLAPFCWFATWQCRQLLSRSDSDTVLGKMQAFLSIFINFTSKTSLTNSCVLLLSFHTYCLPAVTWSYCQTPYKRDQLLAGTCRRYTSMRLLPAFSWADWEHWS